MHRASTPVLPAFQTPPSCLSAQQCSAHGANEVAAPNSYQSQHSLASRAEQNAEQRYIATLTSFLSSSKYFKSLSKPQHWSSNWWTTSTSHPIEVLQWIWFRKEEELCILISMLKIKNLNWKKKIKSNTDCNSIREKKTTTNTKLFQFHLHNLPKIACKLWSNNFQFLLNLANKSNLLHDAPSVTHSNSTGVVY